MGIKTSELISLCSLHMMTTCTNCDGMSSSAVLMEVIDLDNLVMNLYLNSLAHVIQAFLQSIKTLEAYMHTNGYC